MATFAAVNSHAPTTSPHPPQISSDLHATPTPGKMAIVSPPKPALSIPPANDTREDDPDQSSPRTPTRHSFAGVLGQRPLPSEPLSGQMAVDAKSDERKVREGSHQASSRSPAGSQDVEMGDGDDESHTAEDDGSDNDSVTSESQRPSKKKKGQRFFCTDYPPCQLSFTRSEHLARHIRKHTGERPFQCHCSRRFSRLDNLRQHAQTVHVNEDIPGDSLAATSTRFQRQIRTDRVRPPGSRSRASTISSQGGHSRGHSRNLSTSSIASTASTVSVADDYRRRPPTLAMAGESPTRTRLALETYNGGPPPPNAQYPYYGQPPPPPFAAGPPSPHYRHAVASPPASHLHPPYGEDPRGHSRPVSFSAMPNPQHPPPPPPQYAHGYYTPSSSTAFSPQSSAVASPTSSVFSHGRHQSESELEYRRRTWHPSTNHHYAQRPATSGLTYHQTPDEPRPAFSQQPAATQLTRLPGIESFDHAPPTPARRQPSPMLTDEGPRPLSSGRTLDASGLHHGLTRLDLSSTNNTVEEGQSWHAPPAGPSYPPPPPSQPYVSPYSSQQPPPHYGHAHHLSMPEAGVTPRKAKRNAWYGGPVTPSYQSFAAASQHRPSPEDSGSSEGVQTPSLAHASEHHPVIYNPSQHGDVYPPPAEEHHAQKVHFGPASAASDSKPEPSRADSGFHQPLHPPLPGLADGRSTTTLPPLSHGFSSDASQVPKVAPPAPTYPMQSGHDPRFAQANHGATSSDSTRLDALVTAALGANDAGRSPAPRSS